MSSGGSQTTTAMQEPWEGAQPYLTDVMGRAKAYYLNGVGQQYYGGDTVVPFSPTTQSGMNLATNIAAQGNPLLDQAMGTTYGVQNQEPGVGARVAEGAALGTGQYGIGTPRAEAMQIPSFMMSRDITDAPGYGTLATTASGQSLRGNPYLDRTFDTMADRVTSRVNAQMGLAGRTGSGAHTDVLADSLGDVANDVYGQNYQLERQRQLGTAESLMGMDAQNRALRLGAAGQLEDMDRTRDQMRLQASGMVMDDDARRTSQALQAAGMSPMLSAARYGDADALMRLGGMQEGKAGEYIQDELNRFNFTQTAPWDVLGRYGNFAMGIGGMGGLTTSQMPRQGGGGVGGLLGGASTGAGIASLLSLSNPWTAGLALGGGLLGAFG